VKGIVSDLFTAPNFAAAIAWRSLSPSGSQS